MRLATALLLLFAQLFALTTAHRDWLVKGLPQCWQDCFKDTEDGCSSSSCICKTSADSTSYLPGAISCTVSKCDADELALDIFLGPLDMLCSGIQCPIPDEIMKEAYAAAADSDSDERPQSSRATATTTSSRRPASKTTDNGPELTSTVRSTLTRTTTDSSGHTLQIVVPIVVGPSGVSSGSTSTSTLTGPATRTTPAASTSRTPEPSLPDLSLLPSSTSATAPQETAGSAGGSGGSGGSGSPFDAPAAAARWTIPEPLLGLVALAMLYMRL